MTDDADKSKPKESPKAAQAFAHYYALGAGRSLEEPLASYQERLQTASDDDPAPPTLRLQSLKDWSRIHGWQDRLRAMIDAQLAEAAEIDAESFVITSLKVRERLDITTPLHLDALLAIRGSGKTYTAAVPVAGGAGG